MKRTIKATFALLAVVISLTIWASVNSYARNDAGLEEEIERVFKERKITAMSIAVVSDDSIIYSKSMGYRVLPDGTNPGIPVKDDDLYCLASVSKTFIATAIMRLMQDKKLKLNDDAAKYIGFQLRNPKFPSTPITIKQLLTHTSGINDSYSWWCMDSINPGKTPNYFRCYSDKRDYK